MNDASNDEWVSVEEAARRLSKSASTIRRMCEREELTCAREARRPGDPRDHWRVKVTRHHASGDTPQKARQASPPPFDVSAAVKAATDPLRAELVEQRARHASERAADASQIKQLTDRVLELTREIGGAEQRASDASARISDLEKRLQAAEWRWWHRLWPP